MSIPRPVILLKDVKGLGQKGRCTKTLPDHYADVLIRRGLARDLPKPAQAPPPKKSESGPMVSLDPIPSTTREIKAELRELGASYSRLARKPELIQILIRARAAKGMD